MILDQGLNIGCISYLLYRLLRLAGRGAKLENSTKGNQREQDDFFHAVVNLNGGQDKKVLFLPAASTCNNG